MTSQTHRLFGLGMRGTDTGPGNSNQNRSSFGSSNSTPRASLQLANTQAVIPPAPEYDDIPESPAPYPATQQRFRIANPDPPSEEEDLRVQNKQNNLQAQAARSFALKPTHSMSPARPPQQSQTSQANMGSSLAPHALAPIDNNGHRLGHARGMSEPPPEAFANYENSPHNTPDKLLPNNGNGAKASSRQIRPSKSSEFLRRLRPGSEEPQRNPSSYQQLTDDELDEDERLRLPPDATRGMRATNSPARTLAPPAPAHQGHHSMRPGSAERMANDFPTPPPQYPHLPERNSTDGSADTFATAKTTTTSRPTSHHSGHSDSDRSNKSKSIPWPMAAKGTPSAPATSTAMPLRHSHSRNEVLFAAETGGMLVLNKDSRTYSPGEGPGQRVRLPDYPPVPPALRRHPNRQSTGDIRFQPPPMSSTEQPRMNQPRPHTHHGNQGQRTPTPPQSRPGSDEGPGSGSNTPLRRRGHVRANSDGIALLARQGTLFHPASSDARASQELDVMLGKPKSRRLSATTLLPTPETPKKAEVRLEASKKSRARVELDVVIERECVVEGGELRGRLEVVVRGGKRGTGLRVGAGKLRVLGYEELVDGSKTNRHIFYQHQHLLPEFFNERGGPYTTLFASEGDDEGFHLAKEGTHALPFSMHLPVGGGAKGAFTGEKGKGPNIKYVVVGSVKLHIPKTGKRAIAHFYRPIVLLPYHNPARALAPARMPIVEYIESGLGWSLGGEKGKVFLQVSLGRQTWVAGQRVWCEVGVRNNSNKKITKCALAILQTINTFGVPKGRTNSEFLDTTRRKVAEEFNEADFMDVGSGHVTSKSWWTGLEPGESNRWDMSVPIPVSLRRKGSADNRLA